MELTNEQYTNVKTKIEKCRLSHIKKEIETVFFARIADGSLTYEFVIPLEEDCVAAFSSAALWHYIDLGKFTKEHVAQWHIRKNPNYYLKEHYYYDLFNKPIIHAIMDDPSNSQEENQLNTIVQKLHEILYFFEDRRNQFYDTKNKYMDAFFRHIQQKDLTLEAAISLCKSRSMIDIFTNSRVWSYIHSGQLIQERVMKWNRTHLAILESSLIQDEINTGITADALHTLLDTLEKNNLSTIVNNHNIIELVNDNTIPKTFLFAINANSQAHKNLSATGPEKIMLLNCLKNKTISYNMLDIYPLYELLYIHQGLITHEQLNTLPQEKRTLLNNSTIAALILEISPFRMEDFLQFSVAKLSFITKHYTLIQKHPNITPIVIHTIDDNVLIDINNHSTLSGHGHPSAGSSYDNKQILTLLGPYINPNTDTKEEEDNTLAAGARPPGI